MDKRKTIYKWIHIAMIVVALLFINIVAWNSIMNISDSATLFETGTIKELLPIIISYYFFSILKFIFSPFGLVIFFYIIYRIINNKATRKNREHPKFDIQYFRDDLNKISPSIVSYLVDFEIDIDRDVCAHLLKLQLDGYINRYQGNFIVTDKNQEYLKKSDKILLEFVASDFKNINILSQYKDGIVKEMVLDEYIEYTIRGKDIIGLFSILIMYPIFVLCVTPILIKNDVSPFIVIIITIVLCMGPLCIAIIFSMKLVSFIKYGKIKRTTKGNELLEQIYGLKNFLSDFTNISSSSIKEVHLREYYLVYAIVLGINNAVDNEILLEIERQIQMNKNRKESK